MANKGGGQLALYWAVARRSFRQYSTYRAATVAGVFTNTVWAFIQAYVVLAVFAERVDVGGLDATDAVTFTFATQGMLAVLAVFGTLDLAERIASGDVVSDLYRPLDLQWWWLAQDLGRCAFQLACRGIPPFVVGALVFDLRLPADAGVWAGFLLALAMAMGLGFAWRFLISLSAFWLLDVRGPAQLTGLVFAFFSGFLLPLQFFPGPLRAIADALPFAAVVQLPVEVFLSKHRSAPELVAVLARQAAWLVVLVSAGRLAMARAWHRVVVQGG